MQYSIRGWVNKRFSVNLTQQYTRSRRDKPQNLIKTGIKTWTNTRLGNAWFWLENWDVHVPKDLKTARTREHTITRQPQTHEFHKQTCRCLRTARCPTQVRPRRRSRRWRGSRTAPCRCCRADWCQCASPRTGGPDDRRRWRWARRRQSRRSTQSHPTWSDRTRTFVHWRGNGRIPWVTRELHAASTVPLAPYVT